MVAEVHACFLSKSFQFIIDIATLRRRNNSINYIIVVGRNNQLIWNSEIWPWRENFELKRITVDANAEILLLWN